MTTTRPTESDGHDMRAVDNGAAGAWLDTAIRSGASAVVHADDDTFTSEVTASATQGRTVVAYFWAEWCPPCRTLGPIMEQLAAEHPETLTVIKINSDLSPRTSAAHQILAVPTLKVFVGGEVVRTVVSAKPKAALAFELARYLG